MIPPRLSRFFGLVPSLWLLVALVSSANPGRGDPLPPSLLARKPEFVNVQLSPDGSAIAYRRINDKDLMSLEILDLATGQKKGITGTEDSEVGTFFWINDHQIGSVFLKDKTRGTGFFVYDLDTGFIARINEGAAQLVSVPLKRKNRVYIQTGGETGVLVELNTGIDLKNRTVVSNATSEKNQFPPPPEGIVSGYQANTLGEPVLGYTYGEEGMLTYLLDRHDETWTSVPLDPESTPILDVAADDRTAWVARRTADGGSGLFMYDLVKHAWGKEVYHDPEYDLAQASLVLSRDGKTLRGITYTKVRAFSVWFDETLEKAHERIASALDGFDVVLTDISRDEQKAIFVAKSSTEPGQYFLADLKSGAIQHVAASAPWLAGVALSPTASFNFKARDGLALQAYLTLPATSGATKPYPLFVLGHGGPWARDRWNYDGEVQFLASRGYAVLQPNYRGSTGFSEAISETDRFDYRKMHEDVTDAVHALVKTGIADPDRLGIMGASFGGYLAIAGAAWEPDLYRVAITNVGVFDWEMRINDQKRLSPFAYKWQRKHLGDDPAVIAKFSPIHQADQIKIPVFIAHGRQDQTVDISQSVRLERILKANDVPHETYFEADSAHGFAAADAQQAYLEAVDKFLTKYFPTGRATVKVGDSTRVD